MTGTCPTQTVTIESDIKICNGVANDAVNDNPDITPANLDQVDDDGTVTSLAMYPRQPFDFAGRTGTVVFDVSDDSGGMHTVWPEFWVTSTPAPDPFVHEGSWQAIPQYGFGIRLGAACTPAGTGPGSGGGGCGPNCPTNNTGYMVTAASAIVINNYAENDSDSGDINPQNPGTLDFVPDNCVAEPTAAGQMNHFEIRVSENQIDIYASNAFTPPFNPATTPMVHLASVLNANLGFTRGLIWLEDAHYNANKQVDAKLQAMHTFSWANVGFDGPVLPRDLGFDALDSLTPGGIYGTEPTTFTNLGWVSPDSAPATITIPNVSGIANASGGGLLTFNFFNPDTAPVTLDYSLNGNPTQSVPWPFPGTLTNSVRTIAIPISLSDVRTGTNTVQIWSPQDTLIVSNVDLILRGAGGTVPPTDNTIAPTSTTVDPTTTAARTTTTAAPTTTTTSPISGATKLNDDPCTVVVNGELEIGQCTGTLTPTAMTPA